MTGHVPAPTLRRHARVGRQLGGRASSTAARRATIMLRTMALGRSASTALARGAHRPMSGLPYRIRAPLAKLQEKKGQRQEAAREATLGDGEKLESPDAAPDYVRLALTSRVYDFVNESPLQLASGLSQRVGVRRVPRPRRARLRACSVPGTERERWVRSRHPGCAERHGGVRSLAGEGLPQARGPAALVLVQDPRRVQPARAPPARRAAQGRHLLGGLGGPFGGA
eukprot:7348432-Prymnesium_polylepis.1